MKGFVSAVAVLGAVACGGSAPKDASIAITSPAAGASVPVGADADKTVPIGYTLENFDVASTCSAPANCGHVHVLIDGVACNGSGVYNNTSLSSTSANALFGKCDPATVASGSSHTVTLELHDENHNPITNSAGDKVKASVTFKLQ